jgi:hypothetical protein
VYINELWDFSRHYLRAETVVSLANVRKYSEALKRLRDKEGVLCQMAQLSSPPKHGRHSCLKFGPKACGYCAFLKQRLLPQCP